MSIAKSAQQYLKRLEHRLHRVRVGAGRGRFSNFDEERILQKYIAQLLPPAAAGASRTAVDIGAGDGVKGSNTYALFRGGWKGLGIEGDTSRARRLAHAYRN